MGLKKKPEPGTKVRLTGVFLRNTGQMTGDEGRKRWTVQSCECGLCKCGKPGFVAVDEPHQAALDPKGYEDVPPEKRAKMLRHVACGNLEIVGAKPKAEDYP